MNSLLEKKELKLNLGGRNRPIEGFLTVDLFEGEGIDIHADCGDLKTVADESISEIYASHILEHFPHTRTQEVLKRWCRVLKPGAKAFIAVPDFDAMIPLYQEYGFTEFIRNFMYGDQLYDLAFHYTIFTFATLANELTRAGFSDVKRIKSMGHGLQDCSTNVDTVTKKPISLNVEATK